MLDKMTIRDIVYTASWIAGVYLAYEIIEGVELTLSPEGILAFIRGRTAYLEYLRRMKDEIPFKLPVLFKAMVASYIVLKIDVADMVSATKAVATMAKGL